MRCSASSNHHVRPFRCAPPFAAARVQERSFPQLIVTKTPISEAFIVGLVGKKKQKKNSDQRTRTNIDPVSGEKCHGYVSVTN